MPAKLETGSGSVVSCAVEIGVWKKKSANICNEDKTSRLEAKFPLEKLPAKWKTY